MKNIFHFLYIIAIFILVILLMDRCESLDNVEKEYKDYSSYEDTVFYYKDRYNREIAYNTSLEISRENLMLFNDSLRKEIKALKLKNPKSYTKIVTQTLIDSIIVPFETQLPCEDFSRHINIDSAYYKMKISLSRDFLSIDSVFIPNRQDIVVGVKKNGIFKRNESVVTIQNSNPYVKTNKIQNYTIKNNDKFYQKGWFKFGVGVFAGFVINSQLK